VADERATSGRDGVLLDDLAVFARAVVTGSLSAAGRALGLSPAVASKRLARLEARLDVRLLQRTSRKLTLTEEGATYYERIAPLLTELAEARDAIAGGRAAVRGTLRITATVAFGRRWLGPIAAEFVKRYPATSVHLHLNDELVNLLDGSFDLAVRIGRPEDSSWIARRLVANPRLIVAAPAYLERHGTPRHPEDLARHRCLALLRGARSFATWTFRVGEASVAYKVRGALAADNGELVHDWALRGEGLTRKSVWDVADDLAAGRLVSVLDQHADAAADIYAVYPTRRFVPVRVRRFIDLLEDRLQQAEPKILVATPGTG
jgi:DNA-binding transcriptional LysR family regulator